MGSPEDIAFFINEEGGVYVYDREDQANDYPNDLNVAYDTAKEAMQARDRWLATGVRPTKTARDERLQSIFDALRACDDAAEGDSNDAEIEALREAIDLMMGELGIVSDSNYGYRIA